MKAQKGNTGCEFGCDYTTADHENVDTFAVWEILEMQRRELSEGELKWHKWGKWLCWKVCCMGGDTAKKTSH